MVIILGDSLPGAGPYPVTIDASTQWIWIPPVGLLGIYLILLFPDGRLPSRRWRLLAWLAAAAMVLASVAISIVPGPLPDHPAVRNPFGLEGFPWLAGAAAAVVALLPACILAAAFSLVLRYRRSGAEVRQQIKWVAFAASFVGLAYLSTLLGALFFAPDALATEKAPLWLGLLQNVVLMSYAGVPVAVGVAVLRYRLYDIDVLINRTLVYLTLTVTLALVYFASVVSLQAVLRVLTGQESTLAVVTSTLAIAALFSPLRRRVQSFVDKRFYREKYDARKILEDFSAKLRDETDLAALNEGLVGVVRDTMQPAHASLWLRPDTAPKKGEASS
jgi:MFS family permease